MRVIAKLFLIFMTVLVTTEVSAKDPALDSLPKTASTFIGAKKKLYDEIYHDHRLSFYCGCQYDERRNVDLVNCGLESLEDRPRAKRIEAEHVFPASQFGNYRQCWREPEKFPECVKSSGKSVSGRTCCERVDPVFETAHNDLMNLYPAVGEINADRSNFRWGMIPGEKPTHGRCKIEINPQLRRAEPPENVMGDIARTMFYMEHTYGFRLSDQQRKLYEAWNKQDPPDEWEVERNRRIAVIQGKSNPFIDKWETDRVLHATDASTSEPDANGGAAIPAQGFTCTGKTRCKEMASCEEATFYMTACGVTTLDGNNDGIPCNALCR